MSFSDRRSAPSRARVLRHGGLLHGVLLGGGLVLFACARDAREDGARIERLSPGWGLTTESVSGVLEGENFLRVPTQHVGAAEPVTLESRFEILLGAHRLEDVTWVDERTLGLRVPAGLEPGWYGVTVLTPLGERVERPRAYYVSDRPLASLRARFPAGPTKLWVGEETRLTVTVDNPGGTRALGVRARLKAEESGTAPGTVVVRAEPATQDVEPGGQALFTWTLGADTAGPARFTLELEGREEHTELALSAAPPEAVLQLDAWERLTSALTVEPSPVSEGLPIILTVHLKNPGPGRLRDVSGGPPQVEGGRVDWAPASEPPRLTLEPHQEGVLRWRGVARSAGELHFRVQGRGVEEGTGEVLPILEATSAPLVVFSRGRLVTQFDALPVDIRVGQFFSLGVLANNAGQSSVLQVQLDQGQLASPHAKTCRVELAGEPTPSSVALLPGGGRTRFSARLKALAPGECSFQVRTQGIDAVDNRPPLQSELATSATLTISP